MFREARRQRQFLSREEAERLLKNASSGVLSVCGDDGYPYGVPVSYAYEDGKIYIHSSPVGHKIDAITRCDKVSLSAIVQDKIIGAEYTTHFISVIAFGRARVLTDGESRVAGLLKLMDKYSSDIPAHVNRSKAEGCHGAVIIEVTVEHLTAKQSTYLVKE